MSKPPTIKVMHKLGLVPDPWQVRVLESERPRLLLNCCRQAGKSTTVAVLALVEAVFVPGSQILLMSRSHRQSRELYRRLIEFWLRLGSPLEKRRTLYELELENGSRVVSLPCNEETIRGYASITLLVIDEAARVPDDLYRAVRPMLAVSGGRLVCLSTPFGKRGFYYEAWAACDGDWERVEVPADRVPRITPAFLEQERRAMGEAWFRQEYYCSFEALEGLVYPDFGRCVAPAAPPALTGRSVGGIDFGFRNPFAAVWGTLGGDGILWLTGERYVCGKPLSHHVQYLPRRTQWYCDPAGAAERCELIHGGFTARAGVNAVRQGIAAVTARIGTGTLRIVADRCPNPRSEAQLYRYDDAGQRAAESPLAELLPFAPKEFLPLAGQGSAPWREPRPPP
jgi:hypothetical protein